MWQNLRKCFALGSLIIGATAVTVPDVIWSKILIAFATGLNAASLYLINEEEHIGKGQARVNEESEGS